MTRKQICLLAGAAAAVLLIAAISIPMWISSTQPAPTPTPERLHPVPQTAAPTEKATESPASGETAQPTASPQAKATSTPDTAKTPATAAPVPAVPAPAATPAPPENIRFPYTIPGTSLVVQGVKSYDGIYLEDGSDTSVSGVASILLHNAGSQGVDYAELFLTGSRTELKFVVSGFPAGGTAAVQADGKAPYVDQEYTAARADAVLADSFPMAQGVLQIEETDSDALKITNLSDKDIPCVRVFYKFCMQPENVYVGGITYVAKVENLKAGASVQITPSHYAKGGSRVIMAKTYDTAAE